MTRVPSRRGGRLWPAVLVASAALVLVSGYQLTAPSTVAADVPVSDRVEDAPAVPAPVSAPVPSADAPARPWRVRSAALSPPTRVVAPQRLVARAVGLDLPIEPTGVDGKGRMALPDDPARLGWYRFGAVPADGRGAVVVAGHVDSVRYGRGPLARASGLARGDRIDVRGSDDRTTAYVVVRVQRIHKSSFAPDDVFARSGPAVLRLITCGGVYDESRGGYQDNLVVTAERR